MLKTKKKDLHYECDTLTFNCPCFLIKSLWKNFEGVVSRTDIQVQLAFIRSFVLKNVVQSQYYR